MQLFHVFLIVFWKTVLWHKQYQNAVSQTALGVNNSGMNSKPLFGLFRGTIYDNKKIK